MERARGGVGLSGGEPRVLDGVGERDVARGRGLVAGVALERGVDGRHVHGLALVGEVGVGGDLLAGRVAYGLEGDEAPAAELGRVDVEGLLRGAEPGAGRELGGGGGDDAAVGAVVAYDVELALEGVGGAGGEALVGDLVDEAGAGRGRHALLALGVGERRADGHGGVVHGAHVEVGPVARDRHGEAGHVVALVGLGPELLDGVGVVGERPERVVDGGRPVGAAGEPHAGRAVEPGVVDLAGRRVVGGVAGVRALAVRVPRGRGVEHAVLVGDEDVPLARGLARDEEGHPCHAGHGVLVRLDGGEVAADGLLLERRVGAVGDRALVGDGEGPGPVGVEQVAHGGRGLARGVGAVGEGVGRGLCRAVLARCESQHVLAGLVPGSVHQDGLGGVVADGDGRAGERRRALGHRLVALGVDLGELRTTADHVLGERRGRAVDQLPVLGDLEGPAPVRIEEVAAGRLGLARGVGAVGQRVCRGLRRAVLAGGEGHDILSWLVPAAVYLDGVRGVVPDGDLGAGERRVALRDGRVALCVDFGEPGAAADDVFVDLEVIGDEVRPCANLFYGSVAVGALHDLGDAGGGVWEVAIGGLGLGHRDGAEGDGRVAPAVKVGVVGSVGDQGVWVGE